MRMRDNYVKRFLTGAVGANGFRAVVGRAHVERAGSRDVKSVAVARDWRCHVVIVPDPVI